MSISEIIEEFILILREEAFQLEKVYLFGQWASGNPNEHSKIDLAIILSGLEEDDLDTTYKKINRLKRRVDFRIEPHPIAIEDFNLDDPFARPILKNGIEIL